LGRVDHARDEVGGLFHFSCIDSIPPTAAAFCTGSRSRSGSVAPVKKKRRQAGERCDVQAEIEMM
jgi:hypothetical protein